MGRTNFILKKKKTATCHLEFLLFFTLLDGEFGFPLSKDFMDPIPFAADEDSIQLVGSSGTMVGNPVRVEPMTGNPQGTRGFWYLQRSFSEKNCTNLTIFFCEHFACYKFEYEYGP